MVAHGSDAFALSLRCDPLSKCSRIAYTLRFRKPLAPRDKPKSSATRFLKHFELGCNDGRRKKHRPEKKPRQWRGLL